MNPTTPTRHHRQTLRRARHEQRTVMRAPRRSLSRLAAAALLVLVVAGPPMLLLSLTGNPLDPPTVLRSTDALTQELDDQTVVYVLALAAWLCWLHLLSCLITETLQQLRGLRVHTPLPGLMFGGNALLASHLIAALVLSGNTGSLTPAPPAQTTLSANSSALTVAPTSQAHSTTAVAGHQHSFQDPADASDPTQLQRSQGAMPMTAAKPAGRDKVIHCRVLPPQGRHHDTLWDIAERHLGNGMRWREIYALNEGRVMPDGQRLTRASLIRPGWILQLPADATALSIDQVHTDQLDEARSGSDQNPNGQHDTDIATRDSNSPPASTDRSAPMQEAATPEQAEMPPRLAPPQAQPYGPATGPEQPTVNQPDEPGKPTMPSQPAETGPVEPSPSSDSTSRRADKQSESTVETVGLGTLLLGAAALLTALIRRRKLAARRRPPGVRHARPAPDLLTAERQLRLHARAAADVAATVRLALLVAAEGAPTLRVRAVWEHADGTLELVLPDHDPSVPAPAPFETTSRGWQLTPEGQRYLFAVRINGARRQDRTVRLDQQLQAAPDPFPLLLPVGSQDGSACLINLEPLGLISLDVGPGAEAGLEPSRPDDRTLVVAAWAQALAGAPWAELTDLYVPSSWAQLVTGLGNAHSLDLSPQASSHASPGASDILDAAAGTRAAPGLDPATGPRPLTEDQRKQYASEATLEDARRTGLGGADAHRLTLALGYSPGQLPTWLIEAAADPLDPNVALVLGPHPHLQTEAQRWTLASDGTLTIPGIANQLTPLRLEPEKHTLLLRLLEHAEDPPHAAPDDPGRLALLAQCLPAPAADGHEGPALEETPSQGLDTERIRPIGREAPQDPPLVIDLTSLAASPDLRGASPTASDPPSPEVTPAPEADPPPTAVPEPARAAEMADPADSVPALPPGPVEVCVLGPLEVHGTVGTVPRKQALDVLVHLALHRRPVPAEVLFEAVWPSSGYNSRTLRNRVSEVRGYIAPGVNHVRGGYTLPDLVQTDWQRFQSLAQGDTDAQLAALQLVRGRPFEGSTLEWMHLEGHFAEMEAAIVDLALEVGERALRNKQYETARTACYAGLRGCPYDERIYRIGMEAAAALGATAEVRELRRRLDLILEEEVGDDIQPATEALYRRLENEDELRARRHQRHA